MFTSARHDESRCDQGWSQAPAPSLTNSTRLVPSRFNPGGLLLPVVFFVYGPHRPKDALIFFSRPRCKPGRRADARALTHYHIANPPREEPSMPRLGLNDTHSAAGVGCAVWTVCQWRRRSRKRGRLGFTSHLGRPATGPFSTFPQE